MTPVTRNVGHGCIRIKCSSSLTVTIEDEAVDAVQQIADVFQTRSRGCAQSIRSNSLKGCQAARLRVGVDPFVSTAEAVAVTCIRGAASW